MAPPSLKRPPLGKFLISFPENKGQTWNYSLNKKLKTRTPGAFRAFDVKALLGPDPKIDLYEWKDLVYPNREAEREKHYPRPYCAITHVWQCGLEAIKRAPEDRALVVTTKKRSEKNTKPQTINWLGLQQIAAAADQLSCRYLWLDFLCIDQVDRGSDVDSEKGFQLMNMANIYKFARYVIVMIGGIAAVQSVQGSTTWMDRAWPLQESSINTEPSLVLVRWDFKVHDFHVPVEGAPDYHVQLKPVGNSGTYLIPLRNLLEMAILSSTRLSAILDVKEFRVKCLDGSREGAASEKLRSALLAVIRGVQENNDGLKWSGAWRSMLMRTSSRPSDIAYSVTGLFDVTLDLGLEDRPLEDAFRELMRKAAAKHGNMAWLTTGGFDGSLIPRHPASGLMPCAPEVEAHDLPVYMVGSKEVVSEQLIDGTTNYIPSKNFKIKFDTDSQPHIVCAPMYSVERIQDIPLSKDGPNKEQVKLGGVEGLCHYRGDAKGMAVLVGKVAHWSHLPKKTSPVVDGAQSDSLEEAYLNVEGYQYVLFMSNDHNKWSVCGDGVWASKNPKRGKLPDQRWHFIVGEGAQTLVPKWRCDHQSNQIRCRELSYSYGVVPLDDPMGRESDRPVKWIGYKGKMPPSPKWVTYDFNYKGVALRCGREKKEKYDETYPLYLAISDSADPPDNLARHNRAGIKILEHCKIPMLPYDVDYRGGDYVMTWEEALKPPRNEIETGYQVKVEFREDMIYARIRPGGDWTEDEWEDVDEDGDEDEDEGEDSDDDPYTKTVVVPYDPVKSARIMN